MVRADRRKFFDDIAKEAENAAQSRNMRKVYQAVKQLSGYGTRSIPPLKDREGNILTNEHHQRERWREFFESANQETPLSSPDEAWIRRNPHSDSSPFWKQNPGSTEQA